MEISLLPLRNAIQKPKFVQQIDWISNVWPKQEKSCPQIEYFFMTSVKGRYMDYHIDMSGSSVWYHVFIGQKEFCLIEPTEGNIIKYEKWLNLFKVNPLFFPDLIEDKSTISYVQVSSGETNIIPSGYIHAVYTAEDSTGHHGGNFLHYNGVEMQLKFFALEDRCDVIEEHREPNFVVLNIYAFNSIIFNLAQKNYLIVMKKCCYNYYINAKVGLGVIFIQKKRSIVYLLF